MKLTRSALLSFSVLSVAIAVAIAFSHNLHTHAEKASVDPLARPTLHNLPIRGSVIYERPDGVYRTDIGKPEAVLLAPSARYPRWSPDGESIAFIQQNSLVRAQRDGTEQEVLLRLEKPHALGFHPNGKEIIFTDNDKVNALSLESRAVRTLISGHKARELDIDATGFRLVITVKAMFGTSILAFDLKSKNERKFSSGCSASLSPDGELVTNNSRDHRKLLLRRWLNSTTLSSVEAPSGLKFDNQFWSNDQDWIASKSEGDKTSNIFIHQVSQNKAWQVTFTGDCDRPDLFVKRAR